MQPISSVSLPLSAISHHMLSLNSHNCVTGLGEAFKFSLVYISTPLLHLSEVTFVWRSYPGSCSSTSSMSICLFLGITSVMQIISGLHSVTLADRSPLLFKTPLSVFVYRHFSARLKTLLKPTYVQSLLFLLFSVRLGTDLLPPPLFSALPGSLFAGL